MFYRSFGLSFAGLACEPPPDPNANQQHPGRNQADGCQHVASEIKPQRLEALSGNIPRGTINVHPACATLKLANVVGPHHNPITVAHIEFFSRQELAGLQPPAVYATSVANGTIWNQDRATESLGTADAQVLKLRSGYGVWQHANGTLSERPNVYQHDLATLLTESDNFMA